MITHAILNWDYGGFSANGNYCSTNLLNPKLRNMREIALPQLFLINVIVDMDCLMSRIASKFFYEIPRCACPYTMSCEPTAAAMNMYMYIYMVYWDSAPSRDYCSYHPWQPGCGQPLGRRNPKG